MLTEQFDRELAEVASTLVPTDLRAVEAARSANATRHRSDGAYPGRDTLRVRDLTLPGPGGPLAARLFRPPTDQPVGGVLYLHGGAFALGDLDACDAICAQYAAEAEVAVLAVDYRLAPEHPAPAALNDAVGALDWLAANATELGIDTERIAVAGASAGGALAAGVVLHARDHAGPRVVHQLLVQPVLDDRCSTDSAREVVGVPVFDADSNRTMWEVYLAGGTADVYLAPARTDSVVGLPATTVFVAQHDPLRDEALAYAGRLAAAGIPTEVHHHPGTFHGFDAVVPTAAISRRAAVEQAAALRRVIGPARRSE